MRWLVVLVLVLGLVGCGNDSEPGEPDPEQPPTATDQPKTEQPATEPVEPARSVTSAVEAAKAIDGHGVPIEYRRVPVRGITDAGPGLVSVAAAVAGGVGLSIEVYESVPARRKATQAQESLAANGKLFQAQCGTVLVRIPSVPIDAQPKFEQLAEQTQRALDTAYRDC